MKRVLSIFLLSAVSLKLFSSDSSEDRDIATEELSKFEGLMREIEKHSKKTERKLAHCHRTSYENEQYAKKLRKTRRENADDKAFRQGDFSEEHSLAVSYLQTVGKKYK